MWCKMCGVTLATQWQVFHQWKKKNNIIMHVIYAFHFLFYCWISSSEMRLYLSFRMTPTKTLWLWWIGVLEMELNRMNGIECIFHELEEWAYGWFWLKGIYRYLSGITINILFLILIKLWSITGLQAVAFVFIVMNIPSVFYTCYKVKST